MVVEFVDTQDIVIYTPAGGAGGRVGGILPREDDIVGGEGLPIVPDHPRLQAPGDPGAIPREVTVLDAGDLLCQNRNEVPIGIDEDQGFVDDA